MSVLQVAQISEILQANSMAWNRAWGGGPIVLGAQPGAARQLPGGMHITILSPESNDLRLLAAQWRKERERRGIEKEALPDSDDAVQAPEPLGASKSKRSARLRDIGHGPPDVEALANIPFTDDRSLSNGASIAFLAELHGKSLLVAGDAHASVLCRSIGALLAQRGQERLRVDAFVVPHAGSARNMNRELLAMLECDRYLFSTDGAAFRHPDRETIARILTFGRASPERLLTLVFNYRSATTEVWADATLQSRYHYRTVYPERGSQGIKLQF